jgi:hypothetical protein
MKNKKKYGTNLQGSACLEKNLISDGGTVFVPSIKTIVLDSLFFTHMRQIGIHRNVIVDIECVGGERRQSVFVFSVAVVMGKTLAVGHLAQVFVPVPVGEKTQTGMFRIIVPRGPMNIVSRNILPFLILIR